MEPVCFLEAPIIFFESGFKSAALPPFDRAGFRL